MTIPDHINANAMHNMNLNIGKASSSLFMSNASGFPGSISKNRTMKNKAATAPSKKISVLDSVDLYSFTAASKN